MQVSKNFTMSLQYSAVQLLGALCPGHSGSRGTCDILVWQSPHLTRSYQGHPSKACGWMLAGCVVRFSWQQLNLI